MLKKFFITGLLLCLVLGTVGCGGSTSKTEEYTITVTADPVAAGTVSGGGRYKKNATAKVAANALADYTFVNWTENGTIVSANATYAFPVTADRNLVANFLIPEAGTYRLSGQVTKGTGVTDLTGVTIKVAGDGFMQREADISDDGSWVMEGVKGQVTITPEKADCTFTPAYHETDHARDDLVFVCTKSGDSVVFNMRRAPGGLAFPTGITDNDTYTVENAFWIGETEVTYELWHAVHTWATHEGRGENRYQFANAGREGSNGTMGQAPTTKSNEPVTDVNWHDVLVWCNALTEYENKNNGTDWECVYTYDGKIIRNSYLDHHCRAICAVAKG